MKIAKLFFVAIIAVLSIKAQADGQTVGTIIGSDAQKLMSKMISFSKFDKGFKVGSKAGNQFVEVRNLLTYDSAAGSYDDSFSNHPDEHIEEITKSRSQAYRLAQAQFGYTMDASRDKMKIRNGTINDFAIDYRYPMYYEQVKLLRCEGSAKRAICTWIPY